MRLRVGMIGTGWFAIKHAEMLSGMDGVRVQAIVGSTVEKAQAMAASFNGAGAYGNIHDMLDAEKLDAVYICVPPMAHGEIERQLIERGIPFFIEKPIGLDVELPRELLGRITASGLITSVGYHIRYQESSRGSARIMRMRSARSKSRMQRRSQQKSARP
jgi:myo-inositol 2-dehydrogenase/D-chiro-inositol 1-dehydrogenase